MNSIIRRIAVLLSSIILVTVLVFPVYAEKEEGEEHRLSADTLSPHSLSDLDRLPGTVVYSEDGISKVSRTGYSRDTYSVTVEITHAGTVGTAMYRLSYDQKLWSNPMLLPSEVTLYYVGSEERKRETGITLHFSSHAVFALGESFSFETEKEWAVERLEGAASGRVTCSGEPSVTGQLYIRVYVGGTAGDGTASMQIGPDPEHFSQEVLLPDGMFAAGESGLTFSFNGSFQEGDLYQVSFTADPPPDYVSVILISLMGITGVLVIAVLVWLFGKRAKRTEYDIVK